MRTDHFAAHLASISDADLKAVAVRVRVWLLRTESCTGLLRSQLVRLLSRVHDEFDKRGWNGACSGRCIKPGSPWDFVHLAARRTLRNTPELPAAAVLGEVSEYLDDLAASAAA